MTSRPRRQVGPHGLGDGAADCCWIERSVRAAACPEDSWQSVFLSL